MAFRIHFRAALIMAICTSAKSATIDRGMSWYLVYQHFNHTLAIYVRQEDYLSLNIVAHSCSRCTSANINFVRVYSSLRLQQLQSSVTISLCPLWRQSQRS